MRFVDSFGKGWGFLKQAFVMARKDRKLLAPSVYQVLISLVYFTVWIGALVVIEPHWSNATWTAVGALAAFGSFLIFYFFCGMTVNMIDVHLKGGTPSVADGARDASKNFVAIVFLAMVSAIIDTFARVAGSEDSIVGKIIASIIESIWTMLSFLLLPAIIIEDASFGDAMRRVRALHKGNMLLIGIGEIGVRFVTNVIGLVWCFAIFGVVYGAFALAPPTAAFVISLTVGGTMLALFAAFSTFVRMAYYTCLYLWAADVEKQGHMAPAPLPLAIALGQRSRPAA